MSPNDIIASPNGRIKAPNEKARFRMNRACHILETDGGYSPDSIAFNLSSLARMRNIMPLEISSESNLLVSLMISDFGAIHDGDAPQGLSIAYFVHHPAGLGIKVGRFARL